LLAEFILTVPQEQFDMEYWRSYDCVAGKREVKFHDVNHCGTKRCAIGSLPFSGIEQFKVVNDDFVTLYLDSYFYDYGDFDETKQLCRQKGVSSILDLDFKKYQERLFGKLTHREFSFLFGSIWADVNNTPQGASKRIKVFIENGFVVPAMYDDRYVSAPIDFEEQYQSTQDAYHFQQVNE
jgi:hypothetical protein